VASSIPDIGALVCARCVVSATSYTATLRPASTRRTCEPTERITSRGVAAS
jgi:hypothetical protein